MLHDVGKDYNKISAKFHLQFNSKKHITYLNNDDSQQKNEENLQSHFYRALYKNSMFGWRTQGFIYHQEASKQKDNIASYSTDNIICHTK